jgi:PIN domain nuclease of toxin-antitoxin system
MTVVVDASAVMALMLGEPGADIVMQVIRGSGMSAVNVSECCSRGAERGASPDDVLTILNTYEIEIVAFDLRFALEAARLREPTRRQGASLGDRACLSLALDRRVPLYTSDRRLADIDPALGIDIRLIR